MSYAHVVAIGFVTACGRDSWLTEHVHGFGSNPKNDDAVKEAALSQTTAFVRSTLRYVEIDARPDGSGLMPDLWRASEAIRAPVRPRYYPVGSPGSYFR